MKLSKLAVILCVASLLCTTTHSAVPQVINYQGFLTDNSSNALDTTADVTFRIFDVASGGAALWSETQSVTSTGGLFTVLLGSNTPIDETIINGTDRYLEVQLNASSFSPRTRLAASPFAIRIATVDGASGGIITGDVGIGINAPTARLQVGSVGEEGTPAFIAGTNIVAQATNADNWTHMAIISGSLGQARLNFGNAFNDDEGSVAYNNSNDAMFFSTAAAERMRITSAGNVGVGTTGPEARLHIGGSATESKILLSNGGDLMWESTTGANTGVLTLHADDNVYLDAAAGATSDLVFRTTPAISERMRITDAGNVGIGTANPAAMLQVVGGDILVGTANPLFGQSASLYVENDFGSVENTFRLDAFGNYLFIVANSATGAPTGAGIGFRTGAAGAGESDRMTITPSGDVGIGVSTPGFKLEVGGTAGKPGGGSWSVSSDIRLKKNVQPLENALEKMLQLRPVTFQWKEPEKEGNMTGTYLGMVRRKWSKFSQNGWAPRKTATRL